MFVMPALNVTLTDEELDRLRAAAEREGTSLKRYAHDAVVAASQTNGIADVAARVAEKSRELNERLAR